MNLYYLLNSFIKENILHLERSLNRYCIELNGTAFSKVDRPGMKPGSICQVK